MSEPNKPVTFQERPQGQLTVALAVLGYFLSFWPLFEVVAVVIAVRVLSRKASRLQTVLSYLTIGIAVVVTAIKLIPA